MNQISSENNIKKRKVTNESDDEFEDNVPIYMTSSNKPNDLAIDDNFYLDTINRNKLDFDFEKVCSVSLSNTNVYCCLVCGKYFQGRSKTSYAYSHSIEDDHHVFVNLTTEKFYILPFNHEISSPDVLKSLQDIKDLLNPKYTNDNIKHIPKTSHDLQNKPYLVGYIGLNNSSSHDYANVIIQLLSHISLIRDFYLSLSSNDELGPKIERKSELNASFGLLIRKMWSKFLYKNHVSPQELLQVVSKSSRNSFSTDKPNSPKKFLIWFINSMHQQLSKILGSSSTVFSQSVRGVLVCRTFPIRETQDNQIVRYDIKDDWSLEKKVNFWLLTLDIPGISVFAKDSKIEEVSLLDLLNKYNGKKRTQASATELKSYQLLDPLPPFLIFHIDRDVESGGIPNPTVVKYPEILDMSPYTERHQVKKYKLISSIIVEGSSSDRDENGKLKWSINLRKDGNEWININDLSIKECHYELLFLGQNYIQVWEQIGD